MAELASNEKRAAKLVKEAYEHYALITECPLCGNSNDIKEHVAYQTGAIYFIRCVCGMMYQRHYFTSENLSEYYKTDYRSSVPPYEESVSEKNILGEIKSSIRYMQFVSGVVPKRHLDIGSSTGAFLKLMQHAHECESIGVEPGDIFREYSIDNGTKTVADISEIVGKYDLITMAHVLEHITKPL